jgi:hypothetical protein
VFCLVVVAGFGFGFPQKIKDCCDCLGEICC